MSAFSKYSEHICSFPIQVMCTQFLPISSGLGHFAPMQVPGLAASVAFDSAGPDQSCCLSFQCCGHQMGVWPSCSCSQWGLGSNFCFHLGWHRSPLIFSHCGCCCCIGVFVFLFFNLNFVVKKIRAYGYMHGSRRYTVKNLCSDFVLLPLNPFL